MPTATVARKAGESTALWLLGGLYEVRVSSAETDGAVTVMEFTVPVGAAPPEHVHDQDETVYVIEGRVKFHVEGETVEAGPGSVLFFPRGTSETFEPIDQARLLVMYSPGGIDEFFKEVGEAAPRREIPPPPSGPPDIERLVAAGARHGLTLKPPAGG